MLYAHLKALWTGRLQDKQCLVTTHVLSHQTTTHISGVPRVEAFHKVGLFKGQRAARESKKLPVTICARSTDGPGPSMCRAVEGSIS